MTRMVRDNEIPMLEKPRIKRAFAEILSFQSELRQGSLFKDDGNAGCLATLEDIFHLIEDEKPLYQRWTQQVGDKERELSVPNKPVRQFMDEYLLGFIKQKKVHERCHGGERTWSPKRSLETHIPCSSVLSFDLKSAFENVPFERVDSLFYSLLPETVCHESRRDIANFFSLLCTVVYASHRGLPQGSPCSMAIFNRVLHFLDQRLNQKAKERGFVYSRWVDDMIISSPELREPEAFLGAVELAADAFLVSHEKVFYQKENNMYLMGYKIADRKVLKNSKEERDKNKCPNLNFDVWFGKYKSKNYQSWR